MDAATSRGYLKIVYTALALVACLWYATHATAATIGRELPKAEAAEPAVGSSSWGVLLQTAAVTNNYTVPEAGYITSFQFQIDSIVMGGNMRFLLARPTSGSSYTVVGVTNPISAKQGVQTYAGYCIPVRQGDVLGWAVGPMLSVTLPLDTTNAGDAVALYSGELSSGASLSYVGTAVGGNELPMNAQFEKQPSCASSPGDPPVITNLKLSKKCIVTIAAKSSQRCTGSSKLSFHISAAASVKVTYELERKGVRLVGKGDASCQRVSEAKLKKLLKRKKKGKSLYSKCSIYTSLASFIEDVATGSNTLELDGSVGSKPVKPGSYRLAVTATDVSGRSSQTAYARLQLIPDILPVFKTLKRNKKDRNKLDIQFTQPGKVKRTQFTFYRRSGGKCYPMRSFSARSGRATFRKRPVSCSNEYRKFRWARARVRGKRGQVTLRQPAKGSYTVLLRATRKDGNTTDVFLDKYNVVKFLVV